MNTVTLTTLPMASLVSKLAKFLFVTSTASSGSTCLIESKLVKSSSNHRLTELTHFLTELPNVIGGMLAQWSVRWSFNPKVGRWFQPCFLPVSMQIIIIIITQCLVLVVIYTSQCTVLKYQRHLQLILLLSDKIIKNCSFDSPQRTVQT